MVADAIADRPAPVIMVCTFPPPVGGSALVSEAVYNDLTHLGITVRRFSVSAPKLIHAAGANWETLGYHARRLVRNSVVALQLGFAGNRRATVYMVPNAGAGMIYSFVHFVLSRMRFARVVVQHHSYYGTHPRGLLARMAKMSKTGVIHSFSSHGMAERFMRMYGQVDCHVATNVRFAQRPANATLLVAPDSARPRPLLGHLANLCKEKGFFLVADLFDELVRRGMPGDLLIAGPVVEELVEKRLQRLLANHPDRVRYLGPLYGSTKFDFYNRIDIFLFPSQFAQEAHPLVVYEALAAGTPVLATSRGGIPEILSGALTGSLGGASTSDEAFISFALDRIGSARFDEVTKEERRTSIKRAFDAALQESKAQYQALYRRMTASK
jgi:glycosyltransferase involved in cell wall biosynthesis